MRIIVLQLFITIFLLITASGQSTITKGKFWNSANLHVTNWTFVDQEGKLYDKYDTAISVIGMSNYKRHFKLGNDFIIAESDLINIPVSQINNVYIRKNRNIWIGALIGALAGTTVGYKLGYSMGDGPPTMISTSAEDKVIIGAFAGGTSCALIGAVLGANIEIKIPINRNQQEYRKARPRLDKYKYAGN